MVELIDDYIGDYRQLGDWSALMDIRRSALRKENAGSECQSERTVVERFPNGKPAWVITGGYLSPPRWC